MRFCVFNAVAERCDDDDDDDDGKDNDHGYENYKIGRML